MNEPKDFSSDHILNSYRTQNEIDWTRSQEEISEPRHHSRTEEEDLEEEDYGSSEIIENRFDGAINCQNLEE